jgi:hypothetical protein
MKISLPMTRPMSSGAAMVVTTDKLRVHWLPSRQNIMYHHSKLAVLSTAFRCTFLTQTKIDNTVMYPSLQTCGSLYFCYLWLAEEPSSCPRSIGMRRCRLYSLQRFLLERQIRSYHVTAGKINHTNVTSVLWWKKGITLDYAVQNL